MKNIQLEPRHFLIVKEVLNKFEITAFVFGSRSKNTSKLLSDLPFKVDVVVWSELSDGFKKHIKNDLVKFE